MPAFGLDLSEAYVKEAKRHLQRWSRADLMVEEAISPQYLNDIEHDRRSVIGSHGAAIRRCAGARAGADGEIRS
jgi:hypothetical protein